MSSPSSRPGAELDPTTRRLSDGRLLLGGEPPRLVRLSPAGAKALDALLAGDEGRPFTPAEDRLFHRLAEAGLLHKSPPATAGLDVSFVVPVRQPAPGLAELLRKLVSSGLGPVWAVDDGSPDGGEQTAALAESTGAGVIRRASNGGPAAARNSAEVESELVVYLDADTVLEGEEPLGWLGCCAAHFCDPGLGLVAPRVRSVPGAGAIARYEQTHSPLDLGPAPGLVGAFRRLSYVPATALVARRRALEEVGGFDEALRYGEDVDLVRRLTEGGWRVRYEPAAVVSHRPRGSLGAFSRQRYCYGTAAAQLQRRHPGTVPPYASSPQAAAISLGLLAGGWLVASGRGRLGLSSAASGGVVGAFSLARLASRLERAGAPAPYALAASLLRAGTASAAAGLLRAVRRGWWPFLLLAVPFSRTRRVGLVALATALVGWPAVELGRLPAGEAFSQMGLGLLDDTSYSLGVVAGCLRAGSLGALQPRLLRSRPRGR